MSLFVKQYDKPGAAEAARDHYQWIAGLGSGVLLPEVIAARPHHLVYRTLPGSVPVVKDLPEVAETIGRMHRASAPALDGARLDQRLVANRPTIADFATTRQVALHLAGADYGIGQEPIDAVLDLAAGLAPAFYKDSNLRNFIITARGVGVIDFDDLTLAPYGYDLAKLITSMAMTHGPLSQAQIATALDVYNDTIGHTACTWDQLGVWAELNWLLTANYMGRNGYTHPWPLVRPWLNPLTTGDR